ncbi:MAG: 4-hydroxy-tetrahydrodipicolinate reductase [bacterium]
MLKIVLCGAAGRMGREIITTAKRDHHIKIVAGVEEKSNAFVGKMIDDIPIFDDVLKVIEKSDVIVEFTNSKSTIENLKKAAKYKKPYCIGTTGFAKTAIKQIQIFSKEFPIFLSPNMSLGVNHLFNLVKNTARVLSEYDIEIIEVHHRMKKDAPSGTALAIANEIKKITRDRKLIYGRKGLVGERSNKEICISAVRGGDVVGEHRVLFLGQGEFLELRHYATSRQCFAWGTILAVKFLAKQKPGLYSMADLVKNFYDKAY